MEKFKQDLARVFDDNLRTKQWQNYVDYVIIGMILLSTVEVFLSTYENIVQQYGTWLKVVDYFTTFFFTIEVTLRIWAADQIGPQYKGFWGRIRYCFSFYGLIDILSTYPFYLHFIFPLPYMALKALRIARLLRIFRYIKAFDILSRALKSKKDEMLVSLQFLAIVTLLLSFILFFVEHEAQPDVYANGWTSVLWAFAQYIGDPGGFADTPPITICGRVIACIIGVLGIAIFAVPAGLVASAFSEVMEKDEKKEKAAGWAEKLHIAFQRKPDKPSGLKLSPKFVSIANLQAFMGLKEDEIFDAVQSDPSFRLINLARTHPIEEATDDKLAVEHFPMNRPYGCYINRNSKITIMCAVCCADPITGWTAYHLAKIGGFNYICREIGQARPFKGYYLYDNEDDVPGLKEFMQDLHQLAPDKNSWVFTIMAASGEGEPSYPTEVHLTYGAKKGDETYNDPNITLVDISTFDAMQKHLNETLQEKFNLSMDCQRYYDNATPRLYVRKWTYPINAIGVRFAWKVMCWDSRTAQILQSFAQVLNQHIEHRDNPVDPELKSDGTAYEGHTL